MVLDSLSSQGEWRSPGLTISARPPSGAARPASSDQGFPDRRKIAPGPLWAHGLAFQTTLRSTTAPRKKAEDVGVALSTLPEVHVDIGRSTLAQSRCSPTDIIIA
jgi:hypothetical protein